MNEQEALVAELPSGRLFQHYPKSSWISDWQTKSSPRPIDSQLGRCFHLFPTWGRLFTHTRHPVRAAYIDLSRSAKNVGDFNFQTVLQATGLRIEHCLGIDRAVASNAVSADPILQEFSHRMWWTLVICEWLQRPDSAPLIHETDFDVPLPLNLTDEELLNRKISVQTGVDVVTAASN